MKAEQKELLQTKKQVRLTMDDYVVRLAKSKAAMENRPLQSVVEGLLRQWLNGTLKGGKGE